MVGPCSSSSRPRVLLCVWSLALAGGVHCLSVRLGALRAPAAPRLLAPLAQLAVELVDELVDLRSTLEALDALQHHESEAQALGAASEFSDADVDAMAAAASVIEALAIDGRAAANLPESSLSVGAVRAAAKRILASSAPQEERLEALADVAERALDAHRPHAAWVAVSAGLTRLERWRATGRWVGMGRPLFGVLLRCIGARRDLRLFEEWLRRSEVELGEALNAEPLLLSSAMVVAAEAGWEQHALAMNASLADAGSAPTSAALNAIMSGRLLSSEGSDDEMLQLGATRALDVFVHMRFSRTPAPDRMSHMLAVRACGRRKTSWSPLRNLIRRPWLKIPWNPASANEAVASLIRAGNLRAASSAAAHLADTHMTATSGPFLELLRFASGPRASADETELVFDALDRRISATGSPLPALALLFLLRRRTPASREALLLRGASDCALAADAAMLLGSAAVHWTSQGNGARAASVLRWMHAEGYDLERFDRHGWIACAFEEQLRPPHTLTLSIGARPSPTSIRARAFSDVLLGSQSKGQGALDGSEDVKGPDSRRDGEEKCSENLWSLVLRASRNAEDALVLAGAMETCDVLNLERGVGRPMGLELLSACCACGAIDEAALTLRRMGEHAPPLAYVLLVEACCADDEPNMALAEATLTAMEDAGAMSNTEVDDVIRLYVALIRGYGARADLEQAYAAYQEASRYLIQASSEWMRMHEEERRNIESEGLLEKPDAAATSGIGDSGPAKACATSNRSSEAPARRRRKGKRRDHMEEAEASDLATASGSSAPHDIWKDADAALVKAIVEAAASLPGGLLLCCQLLEGAISRGSVTRVEGYYQQLIHGHATAEELYAALDTLRERGPSVGGGYRASDATIAALMRALRLREDPSAWAQYIGRATANSDASMRLNLSVATVDQGRQRALGVLRGAGVKLDRKVVDYLSGGTRLRGKGLDNANDVLAETERRDGQASNSQSSTRRSSSVGAIRLDGFDGESLSRPERAETKALYDEFEEMLALRDERAPRRAPGEPLPKRDTKRRVPRERLRNAPKRKL